MSQLYFRVLCFHIYIYQLCGDSEEKKAGTSDFDRACNCFSTLSISGRHAQVDLWRYGHVLCGWLWQILQYRCNTDCLAQQWIVWIVMDCTHNMHSFTSVKTVNKTANKILLNMSSTSQCPVNTQENTNM